MRPESLFFKVAAFAGLALVFRHAWRRHGARDAIVLFAYLMGVSVLRELVATLLGDESYITEGTAERFAHLSAAVICGWTFAAYTSFELARMIQRRSFPSTNIFFRIVLAVLITSAISFTVEATGWRAGLWSWTADARMPVPFLPFDYPIVALDGWPFTTYFIYLGYCCVHYRLFTSSRLRSLGVAVGVVAIAMAIGSTWKWIPWPMDPFKLCLLVLLGATIVLGKWAPRSVLGTSVDEALATSPADRAPPAVTGDDAESP